MTWIDWDRWFTTPRACIIIGLIWAGIYLPALGSTQLKREEPRRALPAVHMLETGDWLVPRVGADAYLRKPPLLNWLIALSFRATGGQSEFAARLPSVLAMLVLALTVVVAGRRWLGTGGALLAAIFVLTNFAAMDIGRLAELEALYLSMTGIALVLWLTGWREGVSRWRLWCAPAPFLAFGMLTKGPAHLFFFYGIVLAVIVAGKDARTLLHPAHLVALIITFGPFLAWAIPCASAVGASGRIGGAGGAWGFWWREISSRAEVSETAHFPLEDWLLRVPQGFANFLPWTVLLPLLWSPTVLPVLAKSGEREVALFRGARWAMVVTFLVMSLLPGGSARYVYPLLVVPSVLLARILSMGPCVYTLPYPPWLPLVWQRVNAILFVIIVVAAAAMPFFAVLGSHWSVRFLPAAVIFLVAVAVRVSRFFGEIHVLPQALISTVSMVLITAVYACAAIPQLNRSRTNHSREVAASIRARVPVGNTLAVLDDGYHAFWYYLEPKVIYFRRSSAIPSAADIDCFLVPAGSAQEFTEDAGRQGIRLGHVFEAIDGEHHTFVLLARPATAPKLQSIDLSGG